MARQLSLYKITWLDICCLILIVYEDREVILNRTEKIVFLFYDQDSNPGAPQELSLQQTECPFTLCLQNDISVYGPLQF